MRLLYEVPDDRVIDCRDLAEGRRGVTPEERAAARLRLLGIRKPDPEPTLQRIVFLPPTRAEDLPPLQERHARELGLADRVRDCLRQSAAPLTVKEVAATLKVGLGKVQSSLSVMHMNGSVEREGVGGMNAPFRYYVLPEN